MTAALVAQLAALARARGLDLGEVRGTPGGAIMMPSSRGTITVLPDASAGGSHIALSADTHTWALGHADDLLDAARVADAWRRGDSLARLHARFPFMVYTPLAQAYEDGDPAAFRWRELLAAEDLDLIRPLLLAAHAEPRLRVLPPSVSHLTRLRLDVDHLDPVGAKILILRTSDELFRVWLDAETDTDTATRLDAHSVEAAVAAAVALLEPAP